MFKSALKFMLAIVGVTETGFVEFYRLAWWLFWVVAVLWMIFCYRAILSLGINSNQTMWWILGIGAPIVVAISLRVVGGVISRLLAHTENTLQELKQQEEDGQGVLQDDKEVVRLYRLAAERGYAKAQSNLGLMYRNGQGVTQDYKEAVKWYRLAAEQSDAWSQTNLGLMYAKGHGVTQDDKEAVRWLRLAAAQGVAKAQYNLGVMYGQGRGVPQDYALAHMWWNIASAAGDAGGTENRDLVAKQMTPQQIEKAQDMARACQARNFKGC